MPASVRGQILDELLRLLEPARKWRTYQADQRWINARMQSDKKKRPEEVRKPAVPDVLPFLSVGINNVTKALELQIAQDRRELFGIDSGVDDRPIEDASLETTTTPADTVPEAKQERPLRKRGRSSGEKKSEKRPPPLTVKLVFVSRGDVQSPNIVNHLPTLVGVANATARLRLQNKQRQGVDLIPTARQEQRGEGEEAIANEEHPDAGNTLLVGFDEGAEARISQKLGISRCAAFALSVRCLSSSYFFSSLITS
jgi:hypothetical protein